jgi:type I restriction-modification system DNA methylase subunit
VVETIRKEIVRIGYSPEAVISDYSFSDVISRGGEERLVDLAAFTDTPPSYRSAAFGVVHENHTKGAELVNSYRALGAPLLFVLGPHEKIGLWQVRSRESARLILETPASRLGKLFDHRRTDWEPQAIHRAKAAGHIEKPKQLDFIDLGLMTDIEGYIHEKLNQLLGQAVADAIEQGLALRDPLSERELFRTIFRLLAAKILRDRKHELAKKWDENNIEAVLDSISGYYSLPKLRAEQSRAMRSIFAPFWLTLRRGLNFRNISADDLAFVYENTLVTKETRKHFGTHSTPRAVAEYVVNGLNLWRYNPEEVTVYEPFAGSGVFLVAALRKLKELLPVGMNDRARHQLLVKRIAGDELDAFACEVAILSLILADYPNANGWRIGEIDLFRKLAVSVRAKPYNVILCNPPFERFSKEERLLYPEAAATSVLKTSAALSAILDNAPLALGFVLPRPFIFGAQYKTLRRRIEELYSNIELVTLPDRTFKASVVRSALLIAHNKRIEKSQTQVTELRSTVVADRDRNSFLATGAVTETRIVSRKLESSEGELWIPELHRVWEYLVDYPKLDDVVEIHRGLEWNEEQSKAFSETRRPGFSEGLFSAHAVHQYVHDSPVWLDTRPGNLRVAGELPWIAPKILANAARISRGPWCIAATLDREGLVASQQLLGIWLRECVAKNDQLLESICAVINGPLGNAYISANSPPDRFRINTLKTLPLPKELPRELLTLVRKYSETVNAAPLFSNFQIEQELLDRIDALVLKAYDLPPRLETELLEYFRNRKRPTVHPWKYWFPEQSQAFTPLYEHISGEHSKASGHWVLDVFSPLPEKEAALLRDYLGS